MHGYSEIHFSNAHYDSGNSAVIARKPAIVKAGGTSLKNRKKKAATNVQPEASADANPWANLGTSETGQINEDSLMQDESNLEAITSKFAADSDRIMPGKPCDNCNCGAKEIYEGTVTKDQLETGQVESSCGSCYLGDAFRCAGCPFRGKPAFEPGDKVKLQEPDASSSINDNRNQAAQITTAQTGSTKVVLEL